MNYKPNTKEEMCRFLSETYPHFSYDELMTHNESQIFTLFNACQDEEEETTSFEPKGE